MDNCAGAVENRAGLNLKRRRKEEIMSNRLFQGVIHQMRDSIDRTIGVIDESSVIIACSELGKIGEVTESVTAEDIASQAAFVSGNYTYKSFGSRPRPEYAVFVSGNDPEAAKYVGLLAVSLNSIKQYYDEKYDRSNFIKNVILDNILPGDIYLKSRELRFNSDVSRVCMLIKVTNQTDVSAYDVVQNLFPDKNKDFVININETDIALVKEIRSNIDPRDIDKLAGSIESLDHETLFTIQRFFENNQNVSETSRKLFVHRNTLVYRLEKIKKITGLDLREFEDAIVFKVALMVKKYLSSSPSKF